MKGHPFVVLLGIVGSILTIVGFVHPLRPPEPLTEWRSELEGAVHAVHKEILSPGAEREEKVRQAARDLARAHHLKDLVPVEQAAASLSRSFEEASDCLHRGVERFKEGRLVDARREFASAVRLDPGNADAWSNLGAVRMLLHDVEGAREAYDRAIVLAPNEWKLRYNFGLFFARTGSPEEAMKHLRIALGLLRQRPDLEPKLRDVLHELRTDSKLESLRQTPGFEALVAG